MTRFGTVLALGALLGCTLTTHDLMQMGTQAAAACLIVVFPAVARGIYGFPDFRRRLNFGVLEIGMIISFPILVPWLLILESREVRYKYVKPMHRLGVLGPMVDTAVIFSWYQLGQGWLLGLLALTILVPVHLAALRLWGKAKGDAGIA